MLLNKRWIRGAKYGQELVVRNEEKSRTHRASCSDIEIATFDRIPIAKRVLLNGAIALQLCMILVPSIPDSLACFA